MSNTVVPKGSLVLVTGANGYIASHIVDQLLRASFKVRGTVRSEEKGQWMLDHFNAKYPDSFSISVVPDMAIQGAFDTAVQGCVGIIHAASIMAGGPDPNKVIPQVISGLTNTLESAAKAPSVKRFVYTSSSCATAQPKPNVEFDVDENSWNQEASDAAWAPPPYDASRGFIVYGASKAEGEKALWKFVEEKKPNFIVNAVLPNANFGPIIKPEHQHASTGKWAMDVLNGGSAMDNIPPQYAVDVRDTARLHVASLIDPEIQNERVFAFTDPFNKNDVIDILQKLRPDQKIGGRLDNPGHDRSRIVRRPRTEEILKKNFGQDKLIPLAEMIEANIAHLK